MLTIIPQIFLLSGKLTLINGSIFIGGVAPNDKNNNDIEYSSSGSSAIDVQGGNLTVNGQIRRNPLNAGGILQYSQSGGKVTINGQAQNTTNAKLEVLNGGSNFTMSGGTLNIIRGNGGSALPSSPFGDLYLRPETGSITGGTISFTPGTSAPQNYTIDANIPLNNVIIAGAAGQAASVRLLISPLVVNGDMTINANSILDANNINVTFNGNLINAPGTGGYIYGSNITTFSAPNGLPYSGAQLITGATDFYDLVVSPGTSLTLSNQSTVNHNLTLSTGNFKIAANAVYLTGDLTNNAGYLDTDAAGNGIIMNGTSLQHINGTGYYSRLTLNNPAGAQIENDITLNEDLTMTQGILDIKKNLVTLGTGSLIQGAPFSATKMITSDGVFSNVGLRKFFNTGAQPSFLFPLGTSGKYTPALLNITASSFVGSVRINNINSRHPAILDPTNALDYYWEVQSSGITGFSGSLELNYYQEDVVGDESTYQTARIMVPGTAWDLSNGVDDVNNKIVSNYSGSNNLSGEYTAGGAGAFFTNVPEYTSNKDGNWSDPTIWTQSGGDPHSLTGGPNGFIVNVNHVVTLDANFCSAYRTTINNTLKVTSAFYGHNLGTVTGSGTLYLESGTFPAGVYSSFLSCANNSTVEYGGTGTYTIVADLYDNISKIVFSGTGTRVLPDKNLTICSQLKINGPSLPSTLTLDNSVYNRKLIIQGTMERYGSGSIFKSGTGAGATVSFAGSGPQTIGGPTGDFAGSSAFNNFEINNSAGLRINNAGAIEVSGNLMLTNGLINTGSGRTLTITNSSNNCVLPAGGSANSFVDGPLIKNISQFDYFTYPIGIYIAGPGNTLGNNLKLSSTQTGPLLWSAQYFSPNLTSASVTAPLLGVSSQEYYTVKAAAGSQTLLNINWTPTSDVNPLITGGLSNIRLANYNTGTSKWVEIPAIALGNNSNGTATSAGIVTSTGSDDYTLGSITDLKPRAKLAPTGPVCGSAGIPVSFTAPVGIPLNYSLSYTVNGAAQTPVSVTSVPYTLSTPVPGVYKLTDFTYDIPGSSKTGVVDAGTVTVNPVPDNADAGLDRTLCGITTVNLAGNAPVVGTGLWSIVSGAGGTIIAPSDPLSQFIGLNGISYTLRWTISSGTCISTDDVVINFTILPSAPSASATQSFCGPATIADLVATAPVGSTVDWYDQPSGGVLLPGITSLTNGLTYYAESNGGCVSVTRTAVTVTINSLPSPGLIGPNLVCQGSAGNVYTTESGMSNYIWTVVGGSITSGGLGTDATATVTWNTTGPQSISVNYKAANGCTSVLPTVFDVTVNDNPTITLGADPSVCSGTTSASLVYTSTTGSPDRYSIVYDAAALTAGFVNVSNVVLPSSPISVVVPGAAAPATYTGTLTVANSAAGCVSGTYAISVTVIPDNTIVLSSGAGTDAQTKCINTAITDITYTTTGASGATFSGLPTGVSGSWAANTITISGIPSTTLGSPFTYTITLTGGCGAITKTGTISVAPDATIALSSAAGTDAQSLCINVPITSITYTIGGGGTGAGVVGLPAGVTGSYLAGVFTISGTPTVAGTFNYTVTTTGTCVQTTALGSITVNPDATIALSSAAGTDAQSLCINTPLTSITYTIGGGGTGAGVAGLPAGVTGSYLAGVFTISGTPTVSGTFNYTVTTTGTCVQTTALGSITVNPDATIALSSAAGTDAQSLCINVPITSITYTIGGGGTGAGVVGLPAGVNGVYAAGVFTISGTPTVAGPLTIQ